MALIPKDLHSLDVDTRTVADAMVLLWTWRPRTAVYELIQKWGLKNHAGKAFTQMAVKDAWEQLRRAGLLVEHSRRQGYAQLHDKIRGQVYRELLTRHPIAELRSALHRSANYDPSRSHYGWPLWEDADTIAILRLAVFSGAPISDLEAMQKEISGRNDWGTIFYAACMEAFDPVLMDRVTPEWRWRMATGALGNLCQRVDPEHLPFFHWTMEQVKTGREAIPGPLRLQLAEVLLHRGEFSQMVDVLKPIEKDAAADVLRAGIRIQQGQWAPAQAEMEAAFKILRKAMGIRTRLLPYSLTWIYPLSLLAQQPPKHLDLARKFCLGEAGLRTPSAHDFWGIWVHAVNVRLGDATLEPDAFQAFTRIQHPWVHFERAILRAWLRPELRAPTAHFTPDSDHATAVTNARKAFQDCGFTWLDAQLAAAEKAFRNEDPGISFFVTGGQESWRNVLTSLQSLATDIALTPDAHETRLLWSVHLGPQGTVETIEPLEQKRGQRGWGKPKAISLAKIAGNERLAPWDAQVIRAIRKNPHFARSFWLDRAAALIALIGHPGVILQENPDILVDVVEGTPEITVSREGDRYVMRVEPMLQRDGNEAAHGYGLSSDEKREWDALRLITVLRDSPQRLRVIRLTPAQRRAAQLIADRLILPADAQPELQQTLQVLASHFQVQSDHAQAAREIPAESQLRAELSPVGDGLMLRLVVAPLGAEGPRFMPGHGHQQVMAAIKGETVGTRRQLGLEKDYLNAVLDALPFLPPPGRADIVCEWVVDDPEEALNLVERLPHLEAVAAIDWPRGKPVRVQTIDVPHLKVAVGSSQDWFSVKGTVTLHEGLVLDLKTLMEAAQGNSRFIPMGEGIYAALTRELRERLNDLAAVAEPEKKGGLRVPPLAASWLDDLLAGTSAEMDGGFRDRIKQLQAAQGLQSELPTNLQATLRPYQEEGYLWAMRLAEAGFGACLADDMGLGKTLQAIAVLLARASSGPALVVAPTSVCGNWRAELERFAPSLHVMFYGAGDRSTILETAGPRDVVIVSYTLLQQAQTQFAARRWYSVVVDEAQAIKNATTKRSLALFDLQADFRLALSGTPVENRLTELWSILRFCNPGLLGPLSRFNERFAVTIERDRNRDAQRLLRRLVAPFILRRAKSQVLQDLPPRTEMTLTLTPDPEEAAHYEALRRQALAESENALQSGENQAQFHILAQLTRLRRSACDPRLVSPDLGIVGGKVKAFAELAAELAENGHKTLVFSQFVDFLTLLRAPLDDANIAYQYLDGGTPAAERDRRVAAFQAGEGHLFLISLKAGGFGLNLTAADYVIIADPWWNPAAEDQAAGRAHRIGQHRPVTVYRLVTQGTLEEKIIALHHEKRALAEGVLTDGGEGATLPSSDELLSLMRETHMPKS